MRPNRGGVNATPPYFFEHSGVCIVAGNAWCLPEDLRQAREKYPEAPIIAVNGASREVKAFALFSYHPEKFFHTTERWAIQQSRRFGDNFRVHGCFGNVTGVDHWWEGAKGGGTSAWGARKLAWLMGFDLVVMVGCPLEVGPYVGNHNIGGFMHRKDVINRYRKEIKEDKDWHEGVVSMSGWTRRFFGC